MAQYGLGRGLEALIPRKLETPQAPAGESSVQGGTAVSIVASADGTPLMVAISSIAVNDYQPRQDFGDDEIAELAESIREYGIIQPLVVTRVGGDAFRLIAGERRLRAAKRAGLREVPVILRDADDRQRAVIAIIENIQRVDLNPIETAIAYQQLMKDFGLTQDEVAAKMGKSRPGIANTLRLLNLHPEVQKAMRGGELGEGHGKVLAGLTLDEQAELLPQILEIGMTVADVSRRVQEGKLSGPSQKRLAIGGGPAPAPAFNPNIGRKEELLREHFGTKVNILQKKKGGSIVIEYYSDDELYGILNKIIT